MIALAATILGARPAAQTAAPAIAFALRLEEPSGARIHAAALRCQIRIDARRRRYGPAEQARLYELFGAAAQWDRTLAPVVWATASLVVPSFSRRIDVDLPVACTYDLEVAASKYLHAVRSSDVPLTFLFSGTMFLVDEADRLRVEPVSWSVETSFRMPAAVWHGAMERFFPGGGWIRLDRETIDRLQAYRGRQAMVGWDAVLQRLLAGAEAATSGGGR